MWENYQTSSCKQSLLNFNKFVNIKKFTTILLVFCFDILLDITSKFVVINSGSEDHF